MTEQRLLLVDDRPDIGDMIQRVAEQLGYEVQAAVHGEEFKRIYNSFNPTTIFLDIVMPDIDGIELIKWLIDQQSAAKIFVASAFNPQYAEMAETLGNVRGLDVSFVDKPFRIADLRAALA